MTPPPEINDLTDRYQAQAGRITNAIVMVWLCGCLMVGKAFAYIHVGPLYITEFVLGLLILNNASRLKTSDFIFAAILVIYLGVGTILYGNFFFSAKDMAWFYYLGFLRFFPRNFPNSHIKAVVLCSYITLVIVVLLRVGPTYIIPILPFKMSILLVYGTLIIISKYYTGIVLFFCYTLYSLQHNKIKFVPFLIFAAVAVCMNFKTAIVIALLYPLLLKCKSPILKIFNVKTLAALAMAGVLIMYMNLVGQVMVYAVSVLNDIMGVFHVHAHFFESTATWRSDIWTRSLDILFQKKSLLFGEFPGHNFMDSSLLGNDLNLEGGDQLGVLRSAHNILVQMMMKTGIVGIVVWLVYLFKWLGENNRFEVILFAVIVIVLGMTCDLFEVPSRGTTFFSYVVILQLMIARGMIKLKQDQTV